MQNDEFTEFDLQVRSMLKDAEEEVPSRVWDAVSSRIGQRKVIPVRWRRAAVGMAAAAAVTAVVFFAAEPVGTVTSTAPPVAEVIPQKSIETPVQTETAEDVLSIEDQIETIGRLMADIPADLHKDMTDYTPVTVVIPAANGEDQVQEVAAESKAAPVATIPGKAVTEADAPKGTVTEKESWTDPFALMEYEDAHRKSSHGVSLFVEGNVTSNERGEGSSPRRAQASGTQSNHIGIEEKSVSTYGIPLSFGIGARYRFSDRWSAGTGINYTLLSRTFTGVYSRVGSETAADKSVGADIRNNLHYVGIPLNIYFDVLNTPSVQFYVYAGGQVEKGIVNHYRIMSKPIINYQESVPGVQWSTAVGLGVEFDLGKNFGLYVDPSARYYFDCGQPSSVRTQKPYMLNFEVGFRFKL